MDFVDVRDTIRPMMFLHNLQFEMVPRHGRPQGLCQLEHDNEDH